jgi:hypothetical protein
MLPGRSVGRIAHIITGKITSQHAVTSSHAPLQVKRREHRFVFQAQANLQIGSDLPNTLDQMPVNVFACGTIET